MANDWLKNLKAGDYVFISSRIGKRLTKVQMITPKRRVIVDNIQFIDVGRSNNRRH